MKDPLSSDFNVGHLSDHDEAQQPSNETDLAGIEDLVDTGLLPSVENHDGPSDVDISKETPPVENRDRPITTDAVSSVENHDGPTDVDISKETPPVENGDGPITTDAVSSVENQDGPTDVNISKETPPVENRDAPITTDAVSSVENQDGPTAVDSSEPPVQNRDGPRSIDEPLVQNHAVLPEQDNGSASDVSTRDKKDSNNINPDKDSSENQTDATQHEVIVKETESENDNKLTTSNKIVIDPAVERDLRRWEAIVTLNEFYKENPQYKNDSSVIDAEDTDESSSASVAPEADGWEPEAKRRKRNTKVILTNSGQLAVQTVSLKKRVPRLRRHICHLCGDDFEMQSNFTKHMKAKHPNDLF